MSLRKVRSHLSILILASTFGLTAVGCEEEKKDETEEEDDKDDDDKDDKKKKKKKKGKKKDKDGDKAALDTKSGDSGGNAEPASAPKKIDVEPPTLDEAAKTTAKTLEGKIERERFSYDLIKDKANANAFLHLAATSTNKDVVLASLRAMDSAFSSYKSDSRTLADENYARVVLMKIQDPDGAIQDAAIEAAAQSVSGKDVHKKVADALADLAANHPKPEGRYAAIGTLGRITGLAKNAEWVGPVVKALDAKEPWLVSEALSNLRFKLYDYSDKSGMKDKLVALLKHTDPGVRGYAAETLASLAGWEDATQKEYGAIIEPLLDDPDTFTKSAAMGALATLKYKKAFHKIITFVDDTNKNVYEIKDWRELNGDAGRQRHSGSTWSTVGDAALSAIRSVSHSTSKKFDYKIDYNNKEAGLKAAAAEAKKWYEAVKGDLG